MSFGQQQQGSGRFRETLKYEDIIHNQIESIRQVINGGDDDSLMYAVDGLCDLITPNIIDEQFQLRWKSWMGPGKTKRPRKKLNMRKS